MSTAPHQPDKVTRPVILILEDDEALIASLIRILQAEGFEVDGFNHPERFFDHWANTALGSTPILLLDVDLPGLTGLEVQARLNSGKQSPVIIFMSGHAGTPEVNRAWQNGASNFLLKPFGRQELLNAIRDASETSESVDHRSSIQSQLNSLSNRQRQVLDLIKRGMLNKQIGFELGISERTVKFHRSTLMKKLDCKTTAELLASTV